MDMTGDNEGAENPDFARGVDPSHLGDGDIMQGNVDGAPALLARRGAELFLFGAECPHYHAPLSEGLLVGDTIRCPWHHACFDIRDGRAMRAPAFDPLPVWRLEWAGCKIFAREKLACPAPPVAAPAAGAPRSIVIVGAGAAGFAAAHALREEGYSGALTLIGADPAAPYDRPNLSKDYLAGTAPAEWLPLRDPAYYETRRIDLRLGRRVERLDAAARRITLDDGTSLAFDAALLATGADPVRLPTPGADLPHVHYLRGLADSKALIEASKTAKRALVIGASFIGLEVAAALRARGLEVHVAAPETLPMERVLGPELGRFVQSLHEKRGVVFHLRDTLASIGETGAVLASGATIGADLVVIGVGVRPLLALAEQAGLAIDRGVLVNEYLETSAPGVYAAGDIARWPDALSGERIRVEHWVVAERQGQTAARNMLGRKERFDAAPFFWSQHYDATISYVGHAPGWDRTEISGDPEAGECSVSYFKEGRKLAVATLFKDAESLAAEVEFERATGALQEA
jgi:NADPH-dependent 2,4-dienoyl-CoA reductase/sulfur reductase-like enzyme/nitrite reductase/ring-hydroxylating ferredoxin subunit